MKKTFYLPACVLFLHCILAVDTCKSQDAPVISSLTYDSITPTGVTISWTTDLPADSKIRWMAPDSNYQALIFTDSSHYSDLVTGHVMVLGNLSPATIYQYQVISQDAGGTTTAPGYFITQSASSGKVDVYFNHSVDTTVSGGENANGSQNFENLFLEQIHKATHSIDITLWGFSQITSIADSLVAAKNRGVKIRFIYYEISTAPLAAYLAANGIPVLRRNYDTSYSMHDKFWIFDYRNNSDPGTKYLWTGSTNVSHPMFHSDCNNIILIQDESLCAVYTREFEQMWGSHTDVPEPARAKFGQEKTDNVPHILNIAGTRMEVYFSPADSIADTLCQLITSRTGKSVFFCMYKFVLPPIESALHNVFDQRMNVSGVFDSSNSVDKGCAYPRMNGTAAANAWNPHADVFIDTHVGLLHHKYFLIDADSSGGNKITVTGSFNWEIPACTGNDENLLVIYDDRINNLYFQEFLARYRESGGEMLGSGIADPGMENPDGFALYQNYPNPFNTATIIKYVVRKTSDIKIAVHDITGREVLALADMKTLPGTYEISCGAGLLPNGIYFYTMTSGDFSQTKKMILIK